MSSQEPQKRRRSRWDEGPQEAVAAEQEVKREPLPPVKSEWDDDDDEDNNGSVPTAAAVADAWATPLPGAAAQISETRQRRSRWDETPVAPTPARRSRWDETPAPAAAPTTAKRSRWDETPVAPSSSASAATPAVDATPVAATPLATALATPMATPMATPAVLRAEHELDERNRYQSDEELDALLPSEGYTVLEPPADYHPIRTPARRLLAATPDAAGGGQEGSGGFVIRPDAGTDGGVDGAAEAYGLIEMPDDLPSIKPEDKEYFASIMHSDEEDAAALMDAEQRKEREILKLLLKIKNGTPHMRKQALKVVTERAREFGPGALLNQVLPLLMSPALEDQERHLLVKVVDRVLFRLDDLVRPFVHKILVVIEPLLIDEDYYARAEGREIISNLAKAAGLATMIATLRPDIDHPNEYVRNTTARTFSVVAAALGIPALLPFLKAVCQSRKSWQARHTGIKIVQQLAILVGCAVLPHLRSLVEIVAPGLTDEQQKVRTIAALAVAALAEAAAPYGIESFDPVLQPLWLGVREHRGKTLAAFLKAVGFIIPLIDPEHAGAYTKEVMAILVREFQSPDEEMRRIVLKVVKQAVATDGVLPDLIRADILPELFQHFWVRRTALDRKAAHQLVETTVEIAKKVGCAELVARLVPNLKDESEPFRRMTVEAIDQLVALLGTSDIDTRLEEQLVDGLLFAFQEQTGPDDALVPDVASASANSSAVLSAFGTVLNSLGLRAKPYLAQICGTVKWRLNNKSALVRQQAADLIARIAPVIHTCDEEQLLSHLGQILYEYLGEEYPEVLGSILGALKAVVNVVGMSRMTPPIKDLLPRLTPILKNRHEKVQENVIDLVGRIADRGAEYVSSREWMRICFELLEMLKAHKKAIRRATVNTFGYIAKAIGPTDVLLTLLKNLRVQERQLRVCTTIAIAIVAETCSPFTVVPALMTEYRVPEQFVQNGVLKAFSFMFEYIGEMGKDYIYAVAPLLEDALTDRDIIHRQTACSVIKHMSLGVVGLGCEDVLTHLLNYVWPNVFETFPHMIAACYDAIEALRVALGPAPILFCLLAGLFHPSRLVRNSYWKIYNTLYIGAQDALVPLYPRFDDEGPNTYSRPELDLFI